MKKITRLKKPALPGVVVPPKPVEVVSRRKSDVRIYCIREFIGYWINTHGDCKLSDIPVDQFSRFQCSILGKVESFPNKDYKKQLAAYKLKLAEKIEAERKYSEDLEAYELALIQRNKEASQERLNKLLLEDDSVNDIS
jgi:hypothetical protein